MTTSNNRRFPAEWETHRATWIAWPHEKSDWPGKFETIPWVYCEIVRALSKSETVEILCNDEAVRNSAKEALQKCGLKSGYRLHLVANDRSWLRDSAATAVCNNGKVEWINWKFNAWAKYDNFSSDKNVPGAIAEISKLALIPALRPDNNQPLVLEGGAIDTDGSGTMLTTEQCLLSKVQERNPGLDKLGYERAFKEYLGISSTIWLGESCEGDDTHGHIDDVARFVGPSRVVLYFDQDPASPNHKSSLDNLERLKKATDSRGKAIEVIPLPAPERRVFGEDELPQSYMNFYIGNTVLLVPTFNDVNDCLVLTTLSKLFPTRKVIGISATDLILGFGTFHCLSQQEPSL